MMMDAGHYQNQRMMSPYGMMSNNANAQQMYPPDAPRPVDNLLNYYLRQEGIDRRYSQLILKELFDATEMTNDQIDQAASELITVSSPATPKAKANAEKA